MAQDVRVKITLDDGQFKKGMSGVQKSLSQTGKSLKSFGKGAMNIGATVAKGFAVVGTAVGTASIALAKTAADMEALDAQFDATFKGMEDVATGSMERISKATNIHGDRIKSTFTKTFSQMKGSGMDAAEALEKTEKATTLAADAAAYYDISLEDADSKLRSFLRGNTEAGDAIGLFTSEAQRAEKATEMYGKSWKDLTEAQKQSVMLNIAEEIYNQSGAIGQAAREGRNFTNVLENLKASFKRLSAVIGLPIMQALIPVMENLQKEFDTLAEIIGEEGLSGAFEYLLGKVQTVIPQIPGIIKNAFGAVSNFLSEYGTTILLLAGQMILNLALGILQGIPSVLGAITTILNNLTAKIQSADFSLEGVGIAIEIAGGILKGIAEVGFAMINLTNSMYEKINENYDEFERAGEELARSIGVGIANAAEFVIVSLDDILFNMLTYLGNLLPTLVEMGFQLMEGFCQGLANGDILGALGSLTISLAGGLWNLGLGILEAITLLISKTIEAMTGGLIKLPPLDLEMLKYEKEKAVEEYGKIPEEAANKITEKTPAIDSANKNMANKVEQGASQAAKAGDKEWQGLSNGVDAGFVNANQSVQQGATDMYNGAKQSFSKLAEVGKQAGSDLYNGVNTSLSKLASEGKKHMSNLYNGGSNSMRSLASTVQSSMSSVRASINSIGGAVSSAISDFNRLRSTLSKPVRASISINKTVSTKTVSATPAMAMVSPMSLMSRDSGSFSLGSGSLDRGQGVIENNIFLDGKLIAKTTAPYSDKEITKINNRMKRLGGAM